MNKKYLLLVGLLPLFYSCTNKSNVTKSNNPTITINEEVDEEADACTVMYVGKEISANEKAIIARSSDAGPGAMSINTTIFPRNALANKTVTSNKGFSYKMPSTTYRYISTPRNSIMHKGHHWEASAINEYGAGVSATLSCYCNEAAETADPLVDGGLSEDNIAQIVGATAKTAREGIETVAKIITEQGAQDPNAIMTIDQNEAWYMEIYSGHQYAAVKCPDNMILTAGNEFVFDSLDEMSIPKEDTILSKGLYSLPKKNNFLKPTTAASERDMDLFETYAAALSDTSHQRTWRGYSLFSTTKHPDAYYQTYQTNNKYEAFYEPDRKLDIHDVTTFMRDRFEDVLGDKTNPNYDYFKALEDNHRLRYIGIENAYQIHLIQSDKSLPKDLAATEWLSISNSNYTPFVPINCSINRMSDYYTKVSSTYAYDEGSAANIFKKLNTLARADRTYYGLHVQDFWDKYERLWEEQYNQIINQVKNLDVNSRYEILTNYITRTQETAVKTALFMIDDLSWHIMNDNFDFGDPTHFKPCVNVKDYALSHGYNYEKISKTVKFAKGNDKYSLVLTNEEYRPGTSTSKDYRSVGEITYGDTTETIDMVIDGQDVYVPYETLSNYIKGDIVINADDYRSPFNHAVWIIPTVIAVPIIAGLIYYFVSKKLKKSDTPTKYRY